MKQDETTCVALTTKKMPKICDQIDNWNHLPLNFSCWIFRISALAPTFPFEP